MLVLDSLLMHIPYEQGRNTIFFFNKGKPFCLIIFRHQKTPCVGFLTLTINLNLLQSAPRGVRPEA